MDSSSKEIRLKAQSSSTVKRIKRSCLSGAITLHVASTSVGFTSSSDPTEKSARVIQQQYCNNLSEVYLAERLEDKKKIAVKAFAKEALTVELKGKESLMNEINVMRSLDHPCLMKLFEVFESDNSFYLVIEHLEGGQLFEKLNVPVN